MKVMIDTNIFISAAITPNGNAAKAFITLVSDAANKGDRSCCFCKSWYAFSKENTSFYDSY